MCTFFSAIVTKNKILWDPATDSHEELIKTFKLNDKTSSPSFVRIEVTPEDSNIFNHQMSNWLVHTDQEIVPSWFSIQEIQISIQPILKQVFKTLFVRTGFHKISKGRLFCYGSANVEASGSASIKAFGSASVEAFGSANVEASGSTKVKAYGSASVEAFGSASVEIFESADVEAYGNVNIIKFSGTVTLCDNAKMIDRSN